MTRRLLLFGGLLLATLVFAQLTQAERDRAVDELQTTQKKFLDSIEGFSEAQWNFKPAPDRWSIAECAEHIAVSEDTLFGMVTQKVMQSPADPARKEELRAKDDVILKGVVDRSQKFKAPEMLQPTHRWPNQQALTDHFKESRGHTTEYVRTTQDDLRSHTSPHPVLKELDAYQWILLIGAHSERHTLQIEEVKAGPNFPKS